ncbi:MAG: putative oxidoreductase, partial [Caulobacteraceae bacterium]|nr:putative oxidoreductase [Caulobacteraceae bacterium]
KIPREQWMAYLRWYREVLALPVRNDTRVERVEPQLQGLHRLVLADGGEVLARNVVFATGIQGGGEWHVPAVVRDSLPRARYAHTAEAIDYPGLAGKRIAILGGGASAFDNAQYALTAGVAKAHVFLRRTRMTRINPIRHMEVSGLIRHFAVLDDARKHMAMRHFLDNAQPPTNDTFARAATFPGFRLHLGAPWTALHDTADGVVVTTPAGDHVFDFLVLSTGLVTDAELRPELAAVRADIALWSDRYTPPAGQAHPLIEQHPYLGPGFEFLPRTPQAAARVRGLYAFNYSALASLGLSAAALSGLKVATPKLAAAISTRLFLEDQDALLSDYLRYDEPEFLGQWPAD